VSVVANVAINIDGKNAAAVLDQIKRKVNDMNGSFGKVPAAGKGVSGLGGLIGGLVPQLALAATAAEVLRKSLATAFERGASEQRLQNLTSSTGEYQAALGAAASASSKFGISQTEATGALADVYGRLKGVGFGLKETTQIYEGFNVAAKQSGISGADAAGVFFQLSQALGKGKLNGDEFISVAERMPQLMDLIAQETGKSRGELAEMASQGKITSDVLYRALAGAAEGATELNGKLTTQQQVMNQLTVVSDRLLNSIGQVIGPVVVKGAEMLAWAGNKIADWWGYLGSVVFPKVYEAVKPVITELQKIWVQIPWDTIIGYVQGVALAIMNGWVNAIKFFAPILAGVIAKFAELSNNPVFKFITEQVQRLAGFLGISNNEVEKFKKKQDEATQATAGTVDQYSRLPPKVEDAKEKAKQLKEAQDAVTKAIEASSQAIDKMATAQTTAIDQALSVTNARIEAEKALNNVLLEQAQRQLDGANSQQERVKAAGRILELTIEQAKLEKESAYATIEAEKIKLDIAVSSAKLKEQEVKLAVELARIQGTVLQAHYDTLAAATELVSIAVKQQSAGQEIAKYQKQTADASFKGAESAAKAAYQSNITVKSSSSVAANTTKAADAADKFAGSMKNAAGAARSAADAVASMDASRNRNTLGVTLQGFSSLEPWMERQIAAQKQAAIAGAGRDPIRAYTAGVTAEVQARSEFQRVIDAKQKAQDEQAKTEYYGQTMQSSPNLSMERLKVLMAETAARAAAASGPTTVSPQINVTTGPVIQQDNQNYVSFADLERAMQITAQGVISGVSTPAGRYATGIR